MFRDLSHHDTNVNYSAYDGFIVKATEGVNYVDPSLDSHIAGIRAAGKPFGLYHFVSISSDPVQQANDFKAQLARFPDAAFRPVIDSETNCNDIVSRTKTLLDSVPNSILYTYSSFISEHLGNNFTGYKLWQADYRSAPQDFAGYNRIGWQYQENPDLNNFTNEVFKTESHLLIDVADNGYIAGWATSPSGISRLDVYVDGETSPRISAYITIDRPDVAQAYNNSSMLRCGYACTIPLSAGSYKINVAAISNDGSVQWQSKEIVMVAPTPAPTPIPAPEPVPQPEPVVVLPTPITIVAAISPVEATTPEVVPDPIIPQPTVEPVVEPTTAVTEQPKTLIGILIDFIKMLFGIK